MRQLNRVVAAAAHRCLDAADEERTTIGEIADVTTTVTLVQREEGKETSVLSSQEGHWRRLGRNDSAEFGFA
jgi:hypothetical protein